MLTILFLKKKITVQLTVNDRKTTTIPRDLFVSLAVGGAKLRADRGGGGETHRSHSPGSDEGGRLKRFNLLAGTIFVPAHIGYEDRVFRCVFREFRQQTGGVNWFAAVGLFAANLF